MIILRIVTFETSINCSLFISPSGYFAWKSSYACNSWKRTMINKDIIIVINIVDVIIIT